MKSCEGAKMHTPLLENTRLLVNIRSIKYYTGLFGSYILYRKGLKFGET